MIYVAFGGGKNSALLFGLLERGIIPRWVVFADTGCEKPETYTYCIRVAKWLHARNLDIWHWVMKTGKDATLESECHRKKMLPSIAYGFRSCSHKWKHEPQEKFLNHQSDAQAEWKAGRQITKVIGYSVEETHRAGSGFDDKKYHYEYPMIDWRWNRNDCIEAIKRAGIPVPPKSACFFCPASRKPEIVRLSAEHPELYERALAMEQNAKDNLLTVKGLGRSYSWSELVGPETVEQTCMCFDGEE